MRNHKSEMDGYDGFIFCVMTMTMMHWILGSVKYKDVFGPPIENNEVGDKYHVAFFKV
jgi:hypothetical protein